MRILLFATLLLLACNGKYEKKKKLLEDIQYYKTITALQRETLQSLPDSTSEKEYQRNLYTLDSLQLEYKARYE